MFYIVVSCGSILTRCTLPSISVRVCGLQDQVVQLTNFLLSRRHVSKVRSASQLLAALNTLSTNAFHVPVAISLDKAGSLISSTRKQVSHVCALRGTLAYRYALMHPYVVHP